MELKANLPGPNSHARTSNCWIKRKMVADRRRMNIHGLILRYALIGKEYAFIKRVIPTMSDRQYKNVLTKIYRARHLEIHRQVGLGTKQEQYIYTEKEMLETKDFSAGKLKGWEKEMFLSESVTLFPLFTYEE